MILGVTPPLDAPTRDLLADLPADLAHLAEADWHPVAIGMSSATVYRLHVGDGGAYFLKVARGSEPVAVLQAEAERMRWLSGRAPVPRIEAFVAAAAGADEGADAQPSAYLLTEALLGIDATERAICSYLRTTLIAFATALRRLHELPTADCPFDHRLERELERARERVAAGLVEAGDFDEERRGLSAEQALEQLLALPRPEPTAEDLVVIHGDPCLPNVIVNGAQVGFVDVGRAGVGDRYFDLALAARSLTYNWGGRWQQLFFEAYGMPRPDPARLAYYRFLDEFF